MRHKAAKRKARRWTVGRGIERSIGWINRHPVVTTAALAGFGYGGARYIDMPRRASAAMGAAVAAPHALIAAWARRRKR